MIRQMIITCPCTSNSLYEDVVIGHELIAERDIVRINMIWMLAKALRTIVAGWNFSSVVMSRETFKYMQQKRRSPRDICYHHSMQEQCPLLVHYSEGDGNFVGKPESVYFSLC
jgi:hypothetical protein